jgi:hypothetical protein
LYGSDDYNQKGWSNPITVDAARNTEHQLAEGNFKGDHMKNIVEVPSTKTMNAFKGFVKDDGTGGRVPTNNQEFGATINKNGTLGDKSVGPVMDPANPKLAPATVKIMVTLGAVDIHSHPSGTHKVTGGTAIWNPPPSAGDIKGLKRAKSPVGYVWSLRTQKLYIYNSSGTIGIIPVSAIFNNPKR